MHYALREVVWLAEVLRAAQRDISCSGLAAGSPAKGLLFVADAKGRRNDPKAQPS